MDPEQYYMCIPARVLLDFQVAAPYHVPQVQPFQLSLHQYVSSLALRVSELNLPRIYASRNRYGDERLTVQPSSLFPPDNLHQKANTQSGWGCTAEVPYLKPQLSIDEVPNMESGRGTHDMHGMHRFGK